MIRFTCPACNTRLESPERKGSKLIACPNCKVQMHVPNPTPGKTAPTPVPLAVPINPLPANPPQMQTAVGVPPVSVHPSPFYQKVADAKQEFLSTWKGFSTRVRIAILGGCGFLLLSFVIYFGVMGILTAINATRPPVQVAIGDLFSAYAKDGSGTHGKYTKRWVKVKARWVEIRQDERGRNYITAGMVFRSRSPKQNGVARFTNFEQYQNNLRQQFMNVEYLPGVVLYIRDTDLPAFREVVGEVATIRGWCKGAVSDPSTQPPYFVAVDNCTIVKK